MTFDLIGAVELTACALIVLAGLSVGVGSGLRERVVIAGVLGLWLVLVTALGATRAFHSVASEPLSLRLAAVQRLGVTVVLPILIMSVAGLKVRALRAGLEEIPVWALVALNATRILGVSFLILYARDRLPAPFAPVAGWGDVLIGLAAIPVAFQARQNLPASRSLVFIWNALGLADLIAAVGLGVTASLWSGAHPNMPGSSTMTLLPWLFIPGFLVPLLATTHLAIFYKLAKRRRSS